MSFQSLAFFGFWPQRWRNLQDYFTPENLTGPDLVQAVTVTFSATA